MGLGFWSSRGLSCGTLRLEGFFLRGVLLSCKFRVSGYMGVLGWCLLYGFLQGLGLGRLWAIGVRVEVLRFWEV